MKEYTTIKESGSDRLFMAVLRTGLMIILLAVMYPLVYILSSSFSSPVAVVSGSVWLWPVEPSVAGFKAVFHHPAILRGYFNTLFYTAVGTFCNVALTVMLAYPLSKKALVGSKLILMALLITMLFDGGLIPLYLTVRELGILNTRWALILPSALAVWQVIIARTFFKMSIPAELSEAAELDGCSDLGFMRRVVLPLSKPIIAVLTLMYAVYHWNSYFHALIFLKSPGLFPLQIVLREIVIMNIVDISNVLHVLDVREYAQRLALKDQLKYALIVVISGPVLLLYPFVQKHFVKGMMIGSIKG